jgi:hypothetical protein
MQSYNTLILDNDNVNEGTADMRRGQSTETRYLLRMSLKVGNLDRAHIQAGLDPLPQTSYLITPKPTKHEAYVYTHAKAFDYVVNTIVMVASVGGGLATIAQLLLDLIRKRGEREFVLRIDSKSIKIRSRLSKDDVAEILQKTAKVVNREKGERVIADEKKKHQLMTLMTEREETKKNIRAYEGLVRAFEAGSPLRSWQVRKYRLCKKKLADFRKELTMLDREIRKLRRRHINSPTKSQIHAALQNKEHLLHSTKLRQLVH